MSPFLISVAARMMDVMVTGGAIRRMKLQLNHRRRHTNTGFKLAGSLPVA